MLSPLILHLLRPLRVGPHALRAELRYARGTRPGAMPDLRARASLPGQGGVSDGRAPPSF